MINEERNVNNLWSIVVKTLNTGQSVLLCSIIASAGSAPRTSGARMLVLEDGTSYGSVGGGPVEGKTMAKAQEMLVSQENHLVMPFNLNASTAAEAGMICGGAVTVLLQRITPQEHDFFHTLVDLQAQGTPPALITILENNNLVGRGWWSVKTGVQHIKLTPAITADLARKAGKSRQNFQLTDQEHVIIVEPLVVPNVLYLVGAGHVAQATALVAHWAGFEVVVMDDRAEFANTKRYPQAKEVVVLDSFEQCLPHFGPDDFVVIVTRGHAHDRNVLAQALKTRAGYIGMIGSVAKRDATYRSLLESGYTQADVDRVFCPIGLSIGADTPEEIAISIVAEMIQMRAQGAAKAMGK